MSGVDVTCGIVIFLVSATLKWTCALPVGPTWRPVRPTLAPEAALAKGSLCYANLRCNSDTDTPLVILQTSAHCEIYFCAFFVQMNFVDDIFAFLTVYVMYLPRCWSTVYYRLCVRGMSTAGPLVTDAWWRRWEITWFSVERLDKILNKTNIADRLREQKASTRWLCMSCM